MIAPSSSLCRTGPGPAPPTVPRARQRHHAARQHAGTRVAAGKRNFGEKLGAELLDVVTGGPKMRKWYGQESNAVPKDGGEAPEQPGQEAPSRQQQQQEQPDTSYTGPRDVVLVMDADTPTGELVTLQLILLRANVRVLVKDTAAAKQGYGPYVEPVSVDVNSQGGLARALRGVKAVVAVGRLGALLPAAQQAGVERIVLLSTAGMPQPGGLAALFQDAADACLKEPQREAAVAGSGVPHVIVKAGVIRDVPGGASSLEVSRADAAGAGGGSSSGSKPGQQSSISREDLATALVASAVTPLPGLSGGSGSGGVAQQLVFAVQDAGPGAPPDTVQWQQLLEGLQAGVSSTAVASG